MSVLLLESIHPDAQALLASSFETLLGNPGLEQPAFVDLEQVEGLVTRGRGDVSARMIAQCPRLRVIARCGAGLDNIDTASASLKGIPIIYAPGKTARGLAEHTLMLMLCMARSAERLFSEVRRGNWAMRASYQGLELRGKTLGIVGMGATGRQVASLGDAFGMHVLYWNRSTIDTPFSSSPLDELVRTADVVSLHIALTPDTARLIDRNRLQSMKPGAFLVNTARGGLVDEDGVLECLDDGTLAGYAADLLTDDPPPPDHPLLHHPRALVTPHSAVLTDLTYRDICMSTVRNVIAVLHGDQPQRSSVLPPQAP